MQDHMLTSHTRTHARTHAHTHNEHTHSTWTGMSKWRCASHYWCTYAAVVEKHTVLVNTKATLLSYGYTELSVTKQSAPHQHCCMQENGFRHLAHYATAPLRVVKATNPVQSVQKTK